MLAQFILASLLFAPPMATDEPEILESVKLAPSAGDNRILGMIPNYQTVSDPNAAYVPLTVKQKWTLFVRESVDPYTIASAAAGAALAQKGNGDPKYGTGMVPYLQRCGAAQADLTTQNFFSDALLASVFHEDPRYFRKGPGSPVLNRIAYAMSRIVIARRDSGQDGFNYSGIFGMGLGIGLSNAYYPWKSQNGAEMGSRLATSLTSAAMGNLLPEFWPDVRQKLARFRRSKADQ